MTSFSFATTPSLLVEQGGTAKIGEIAAGLGCRRVAFVTDANLVALGHTEAARRSLATVGIDVWLFDRVAPDPPEAMVLDAVAGARAAGVDGVVSVGGGSCLDTAKMVAVLLGTDQPIGEMYGVGLVRGERLPLVVAPTTAGTGSEVTSISILTLARAEKMGVVAPQLFPDAAILDADLTVTLPAAVTAATGIDAMVHAIEAYTSKIKKNPVSDCLAREALRLLGGAIRRACEAPEDRAARGDMLLGSMLAGKAFANAPCAAVHALAYPLGGIFHIPHGHSNALVLPYVLDYNMGEAAGLYAEIAPIVFPDLTGDVAAGMIERFRTLGGELGMEDRMGPLGVTPDDIPRMARDAMKQTRLLVNNPREMTEQAAAAIYTQAL
ncbi:MAG: iron-containing alcohol dehydrogenase [Pseudomonadota bacterium]